MVDCFSVDPDVSLKPSNSDSSLAKSSVDISLKSSFSMRYFAGLVVSNSFFLFGPRLDGPSILAKRSIRKSS